MRRKILGLTTLLLFILLGLTACNKYENKSLSDAKLILVQLTGMDLNNSASSVAFSDVLANDESVMEDNGSVTLRVELLDPNLYPNVEESTYYQSVVIKRIKVEYSRPDGLSQQGRDVPYSFTQNVHQLLDVGDIGSIGFVLVQHTAKLESPLYELRFTPEILKMEAKITVYAEDIGGKWLEPVQGSLSVWFGNFD